MQQITNRKSAIYVSLFGALTFFAAYVNIYTLQHRNQSAAAVGMSDMHMNQMGKFGRFQ